MKSILAIIIVLIVGLGLFYFNNKVTVEAPVQTATTTDTEGRAMSLENYIKLNISELSNQAGTPEVLGGKFYVTEVLALEGSGVVKYEDGHNAYSANFTYTIAENGFITITSFDVKE